MDFRALVSAPLAFLKEWPESSFALRPIYGKHHFLKKAAGIKENPLLKSQETHV